MAQSQRVFDRSMLTKHSRCFGKDTKGADGAAGLLEALSQSTQLEHLSFAFCSQIPAAGWQKVPDGAWPKLRVESGIPAEELRRVRGCGDPSQAGPKGIHADMIRVKGEKRKIRLFHDTDMFVHCFSLFPL